MEPTRGTEGKCNIAHPIVTYSRIAQRYINTAIDIDRYWSTQHRVGCYTPPPFSLAISILIRIRIVILRGEQELYPYNFIHISISWEGEEEYCQSPHLWKRRKHNIRRRRRRSPETWHSVHVVQSQKNKGDIFIPKQMMKQMTKQTTYKTGKNTHAQKTHTFCILLPICSLTQR